MVGLSDVTAVSRRNAWLGEFEPAIPTTLHHPRLLQFRPRVLKSLPRIEYVETTADVATVRGGATILFANGSPWPCADNVVALCNCNGTAMKTEPTKFYTVDQVAGALGVSTRSVRRWIKQRKLIAHHFGAAVRIAEADLKAFIAVHRHA